jgi:PTH1 family peptidyl-tRNA hydrolase
MYLIVGLGNPGNKYEGTRHNVGFEVIDYISAMYEIKVNKLKHRALIGEGVIEGNKVVLVKPQTYMNLSGESILQIKNWYKIECNDIIVIYDDISLQSGKIRIRAKGSAGGHNGMKSIIYQLNTDIFPRVRIGVGQPNHPEHELIDYVLGKFGEHETEDVNQAIKSSAEAVTCIMQTDINGAMNKFN